jgi:hypothetical protein
MTSTHSTIEEDYVAALVAAEQKRPRADAGAPRVGTSTDEERHGPFTFTIFDDNWLGSENARVGLARSIANSQDGMSLRKPEFFSWTKRLGPLLLCFARKINRQHIRPFGTHKHVPFKHLGVVYDDIATCAASDFEPRSPELVGSQRLIPVEEDYRFHARDLIGRSR